MERGRGQMVVGIAVQGARAARVGRVVTRTRERIEPDEAIGRALQARRFLLQPRRIATGLTPMDRIPGRRLLGEA